MAGIEETRRKIADAATPTERIDIVLAGAGELSSDLGEEWEQLLRDALAEAQSLDDPERICHVCRNLCNLYDAHGRISESDKTLEVFGRAVTRTDNRRLKGSYCYLRAYSSLNRDQFAEAEKLLEECITHWEADRFEHGLSVAHDLLGSSALMQGRPADALRQYQQSLALLPPDDLYGRSVGYYNTGLALKGMGRWEDAVEAAYQALALAERAGLVAQQAEALELLGEVFLLRDRLARAIDLFGQVTRLVGGRGCGTDQVRESILHLAEAYRRQGDLARAEQVLTECEPFVLAEGRPYFRARLLTARAEVAVKSGRLGEAEAWTREAVDIAGRHKLAPQEAEALRVLALVQVANGDRSGAAVSLQSAASLLSGGEDSFELARVRMQQGLLAADAGDTLKARDLLQAANRVFRRLSATAESGQASRALFGLDVAADRDLALLQGVSGLVSLGLDPQVFITRALELMMDALRFDAAVLLIEDRAVLVVGTPDLNEARLAAAVVEKTRTPLSLVVPVRYQGRVLGTLYFSRSEPTADEPRSMVLETLASLLAPMVQRVGEVTASAAEAAAESRVMAGLRYTGVVGVSRAMRDVLAVVARVAGAGVPVLIRGESGTGKELVARALHESSPRAGGPFVAVNCAALPEALMEAEFFGVDKGAATGVAARAGRFEQAQNGTIFLDEIAEMSPNLQAKLLRVLQEKVCERVGASRPVKLDVRIVTATNQEVERLMADGRFRSDLYYRLNTVELRLPPLRDRREDIPLLVDYFIRHADSEFGRSVNRCDPAALDALCQYDWPGNVRELQHAVERAVLLAEDGIITLDSLPQAVRGGTATGQRSTPTRPPTSGPQHLPSQSGAAEAALIRQYLERAGWQVTRAAALAGYSRAQFYRLMKRYGITRPRQ